MFDAEERDPRKHEGSLLSLVRGETTDRPKAGRAETEAVRLQAEAAARHRIARSRREARPNPLLNALAAQGGGRAEKGAEPKATDRQSAMSAGPAAPPVADQVRPASRRTSGWLPSWLPLRRESQVRDRAAPDDASPLPTDPPKAVATSQPAAPEVEVLHADRYAGIAAEVADRRAEEQWTPLIDPLKVIGGVMRSKTLIAAMTILGALIGVAIALSTPKKYLAGAELLVDPRDLKIVDSELTQSGLPSDATLAIVENQARVLTSGTVLNKVVDRLKLESDPEFNGQAGGGGLGGAISALRSILSRGDAGGPDAGLRRALSVANLGKALTVERSGNTFVIYVGVSTRNAEKSALIANTMTDVFLETYGGIQAQTAGRATDELTSRLDQLRADVEQAERQVEDFKTANDIVDAQGRLISDDEIVKLNEQLSIARARTLELNARAASTRQVDVDAVLGGSLPEAVQSGVMTELRSQYAALKQEADRLAVRLGPRHPQLQALQAQLAGARDQIAGELRRVTASIQVELRRAVQLEQELAARLAQLKARQGGLSAKMVTLRELEREAASKRTVYEGFLLRARQTGEQRDINTANMSVISKAYPPIEPFGPSRATISITGAVLGFLAGVGLGGARGAADSLREGAGRRRRPAMAGPQPAAPPSTGGQGAADESKPDLRANEGAGRSRPIPSTKEEQDMTRHVPIRAQQPAMQGQAGYTPPPSAPVPPMAGYPAPPPPYYPQAAQPAYGQQAYPYPAGPFAPPQNYPQNYPQGYPQPYPPRAAPAGWPALDAYGYAQPGPAPFAAPQGYGQPQAYGQAPQGGYGYPQPPAPAYPYPAQGPAAAAYPAPPHPADPRYTGYQEPAAVQEAADAQERETSIEEIRASLREFREAVRDLAESRAKRRFF